MKFGIEPRFDPEELKELSDEELIELQQHAESNPPHAQSYTEADYQFMMDEIKERFKRHSRAEAHFETDLRFLGVGETAGLIEMETRSGYVRVAIERTPDGEGDRLKLQTPADNDNSEFSDEELLGTPGRWFSRAGTWEDITADA